MPDRVLTLVFTDLVDSTALKSERGDSVASSLISRHREVIQQLSDSHHGSIVDWAGDGCFLTFETPSAGAHFGLELQRVHAEESELPKVRVGVHMGEITETEVAGARRVEGLAVDLAARIQSLARPGQILLSYEVFNSARQRLRVVTGGNSLVWCAHGPYKFKGFDDSLAIGEVGVEGVAPLTAPESAEKAQRAIAPTDEDTLGWRPAVGQPVAGRSHWVLEKQLGTGGFGEVWLATNINSQARHVFKFCFEPDRVRGLKREVILFKVLKDTLGERTDIAGVIDWEFEKPPFLIEAEYSEGGDLKNWAAVRGGLESVTLETRLDIVIQVATALDAAHKAGVLHKDIKPANILINEIDGRPRASLTDFGIGLLVDPDVLKQKGITATGLTQTLAAGKSSSTSGTGIYLAPELHEGKPPSERSDIYSLGVLLYQSVLGDFGHALAPGWERDVEDQYLREDISACVDGNPDRRLNAASELVERLQSISKRRADDEAAKAARAETERLKLRKAKGRSRIVVGAIAVAVIAVIGVLGGMLLQSASQTTRVETARREGIPKLKALVEAEDFQMAYVLGLALSEQLPGDPTVEEYINTATNIVDIVTQPPGATIRYRPYSASEEEWTDFGVAPIKSMRLFRGRHRIQIALDGYADREVAMIVLDPKLNSRLPNAGPNGEVQMKFELYAEVDTPEDTIPVDAGIFIPGLTGITPMPVMIPPFFIDRTEVTNRAFKEFVDAGGYEKDQYWKHPFTIDGRELPNEEAMRRFADATNQPGPAQWIQGDYPDGEDEYPVRGVSWFEAAAYAEFRGKELPSVYHWSRMAHSSFEVGVPLSSAIIPLSNFGGEGPSRVAEHTGIGSSGAYDVAGNVREWCWNEDGSGGRYALGGAWNDAPYMYTLPQAQSPWDRFENNGFRCIAYRNNIKGRLEYFDPMVITRATVREEPLSEEIYDVYRNRYRYQKSPLEPVEETEPIDHGDYTEHTISIAAAYGEERFDIHLFVPTNATPPYKVSIFAPGVNALSSTTYETLPWEEYTFIPKSGRALAKPELSGMYTRGGGNGLLRLGSDAAAGTEMIRQFVLDIARTIDYLESRDDIDTDDLGYIGFSFGAMLGPLFMGLEDRLSFGILTSGGITMSALGYRSESDPSEYIRGITKPVLMLNGKHDYVFQYESSQKPLFDSLGTPPELKKHILYDAGHAPLPEVAVIRDTLAWLDTHQPK
jgi:class 3 adenylate cyclase/formylglycine-generating enzyme required for sulfatase activity